MNYYHSDEIMLLLLVVLLVYVVMLPFIVSTDDKIRHLKSSVKGVKSILDTHAELENEIKAIVKEVELFYKQYMQENPSARRFFLIV